MDKVKRFFKISWSGIHDRLREEKNAIAVRPTGEESRGNIASYVFRACWQRIRNILEPVARWINELNQSFRMQEGPR